MNRRLPPQPLEWIDRNKKLSFDFEGRNVTGYSGDTITSALLADGQLCLGRSFKYHRRRGPLSFANHDINALFDAEGYVNLRGDIEPVLDSLSLVATNVTGKLATDRWQVLQWLAPFLPVGFYYKAFHTPKALFPFWERLIRARAGLGKINTNAKLNRVPKRYRHTDVLVIGGGPSGMAAAVAAAGEGATVILVDENPQLGGSLDYQLANDQAAAGCRERLKAEIAELDLVTVFTSSVASAFYADNWVPVMSPDGIVKIRSASVIITTGVFEQPAVFRNNDVPGVMLASAGQRLISRFAVKPCNRAVVLTANQEGYRAALDFMEAGIDVAAVVDMGNSAERGTLVDTVHRKAIQIYDQCSVLEAISRKGQLSGVLLAEGRSSLASGFVSGQHIDCDGLFMSVGWAPASALLSQAGSELKYDDTIGQFLPTKLPQGIFAAGRVNGVFDLQNRIADGIYAGKSAAYHAGVTQASTSHSSPRAKHAHSHPYPIIPHKKGWDFVDFDEDLMVKDLGRAADEGFDNIELLKRYSTIGMGPSQGKHSNMNGIRVLARKMGQTIDETGSPTARPFFHPVPLAKLAGRRLRPHRITPLQGFHKDHKAIFMEAGIWQRPEYYQTGKNRLETIHEEVSFVRKNVGMIDVSTLGKIEIFGAEAPEIMDRLYTMRMSNLEIGMSRYALMVDDVGIIADDGVAVRRAGDHFYVTTTTGTSDTTFREIQRRIVEWKLDVEVINRTGQLGAVNVAGPLSRSLLAKLTDINLGEEAFPYLGARSGQFAGKEALLMRVGFVGELGYEIHMAPNDLRTAVNQIMEVGAEFKIRPFGVEAQRLLRLEKGHIIVGQDTDGLTNPYEASMPWAVHTKKRYFIGKRSLTRLKEKRSRSLVGFTLLEAQNAKNLNECNLVISANNIVGRVTSVAVSPTLGHLIGMAYVEDKTIKSGNTFEIRTSDGILVTVLQTKPPFYDPESLRQKPDMEHAAG